MKSVIPKLIVSVAAVIVIVWLGFVVFFVNPINWRTDLYWLNWQIILSNTGILAAVIFGCWFALRRIWRHPKKEPNQPPEPTSGLAPGRGSA